MKIIFLDDKGEPLKNDKGEPQELDRVTSYQLTALRESPEGKMDYHHTSVLSVTDHVRAEILSFDTLKVKAAQLMGMSNDPILKKFYQLLADYSLTRQRELEALNVEMNKITAKKEASSKNGEVVQLPKPSKN